VVLFLAQLLFFSRVGGFRTAVYPLRIQYKDEA
jgi:hypothetical protein